MTMEDKHIDVAKTNIERKSDSSVVLASLIKNITIIIIFIASLYFIVAYLLPMIRD